MLTTADYLFAVTDYVAFRTIRPDLVTMAQVLELLIQHNIDILQLHIVTTNRCFCAQKLHSVTPIVQQ